MFSLALVFTILGFFAPLIGSPILSGYRNILESRRLNKKYGAQVKLVLELLDHWEDWSQVTGVKDYIIKHPSGVSVISARKIGYSFAGEPSQNKYDDGVKMSPKHQRLLRQKIEANKAEIIQNIYNDRVASTAQKIIDFYKDKECQPLVQNFTTSGSPIMSPLLSSLPVDINSIRASHGLPRLESRL